MVSAILRCFMVLGLAGSLTGCHQGGAALPLGTTKPPRQHTNRIIVLDRNVRNTLIYINSVNKRLPGGQLLIQVNFQNRLQRDDVWADVKFEFMDANNMMVDTTQWIPTLFPASQVTMIQGSSLGGGAFKHVVLLKNLQTRNGRIIGPATDIFEVR